MTEPEPRRYFIRRVRYFEDDPYLWEVTHSKPGEDWELLEAYYNLTGGKEAAPLWTADGGLFETWGEAMAVVEAAAQWEAGHPDWYDKARAAWDDALTIGADR